MNGGLRRASVWRNRGFLLLLAAYFFSCFGDRFTEMSLLGIMDYASLDKPRKLVVSCSLSIAFFAPYFLLGTLAGWLADKLPRRSIMIGAALARACLLIAMPLTWFAMLPGGGSPAGGVEPGALLVQADADRPVWHIVVPYVLIGLFAACFSPSRAATVPELVSGSEVVRANAMMGGGAIVAGALGSMVGGMLASTQLGPAFFVTAVSFLLVACFVWLIGPIRPRRMGGAGVEEVGAARRPSLREGIAHVLMHRHIRQTILINALFWTLMAVVVNGMTAYSSDLEALGVTLFRFGAGILLGAILMNVFGRAIREAAMATSAMLLCGAALVVYGVQIHLEEMDMQLGWLRQGNELLIGMFAAPIRIAADSLLQRCTANRIRGRVLGISDFCTMSCFMFATVLLLLNSGVARRMDLVFVCLGLLCAGAGCLSVMLRMRGWPPGRVVGFLLLDWLSFYVRRVHRPERVGVCRVPAKGGVLLVCNHVSGADPVIVQSQISRRLVGWLVAREQHAHPLVAYLTWVSGGIVVRKDRVADRETARAAIAAMRAGSVVGVFPQGGIEVRGTDRPFSPGYATLGVRGEAVVVPVWVWREPWEPTVFRALTRRGRSWVAFGTPIDAAALRSELGARAGAELMRRVEQQLADLRARVEAARAGAVDDAAGANAAASGTLGEARA